MLRLPPSLVLTMRRCAIRSNWASKQRDRYGIGEVTARANVQRHVPPVILMRGQGKPRLANDLRPHVERVVRVLPFRKQQLRPHSRIKSHCGAPPRLSAGTDRGSGGWPYEYATVRAPPPSHGQPV